MPPNATNELNYVTANRFYVEIDNDIKASFTECSGLGMTIDKDVYFEGGVNDQQRVFLKQTKFNDVTLKRGITDDSLFLGWIHGVLERTVGNRTNFNILLFNQAGETMQTWTLIGAIPVGWKAPSLQANSNTVAIEELTIAYEGLKVKYSPPNIKVQQRESNTGYFSSN